MGAAASKRLKRGTGAVRSRLAAWKAEIVPMSAQ
jgi:hypothetical protein